MKNRFRFRTRLFAFFLAAQFLNVQIQSAYGTEAVMAYSPEQQQLLQHLEGRIFAKLGDRSERQLNRVAYRLYKLNLKLRNRLVSSNPSEPMEASFDADDRETIATFSDSPADSSHRTNRADSEALSEAKKQANPQKILEQADLLLTTLGSKTQSDGSLSKASFQDFKDQVKQLKANELRSPASAGSILLKVILALLVLAGAMAVLFGIFILLAVFIFAGGIIINVGVIVLLLAIAAVIVGMVFAIKKLFSINPLPRPDRDGVIPHWSSIVA